MTVYSATRLFLSLICLATLPAEEISSRIVDGLKRPLSGVVAEIEWTELRTDGTTGRQLTLGTLRSAADGMIHGSFDRPALTERGNISIELIKEGFGLIIPSVPFMPNYFSERVTHVGPFRAEYTLKRVFRKNDVARIAALKESDRARELKELIAGVMRDGSLAREVFKLDHSFRPAIRELVHDPAVRTDAIRLLAFLGLPEDLEWIAGKIPTPKRNQLEGLWAVDLAAAMLEPTTEPEWSFLKKCASGGFNSEDSDDITAAAIQTLKLIASPGSRQILEQLRGTDEELASFISDALRYVKSKPRPLEDRNLVALAELVAAAIKFDMDWKENAAPEFNESRDKAMIDLIFKDEFHTTTQTAIFHKVGEFWKLRGIHVTRVSWHFPVRVPQ